VRFSMSAWNCLCAYVSLCKNLQYVQASVTRCPKQHSNLLVIKSANEGAVLGNGRPERRPSLLPMAITVRISGTYILIALHTGVCLRRVHLAGNKDAEGRKETSCFLVREHLA
jgi:hypothetical protein